MFYAMAMHKSITPIFSSPGTHTESRPSACNKFVKNIKFILRPLFLSFKSEKMLHFMCIHVAVQVPVPILYLSRTGIARRTRKS